MVVAESVITNMDFDGEDRLERHDFNIEKAIMEFNDEPSVQHNEFPESDEEEDVQHTIFKRRNNMNRGSGNLYLGQAFINGVAFKEVVLDYVLNIAYNLSQYKYDKGKIGYRCKGKGCNWRVYCSLSKKTSKWKISRFENHHTCIPNGDCEMFRVPVIARLFIDKIREEPKYFKPKKIEELIMEKWKINVSRGQTQAARKKALVWIDKEYEEQFAHLRWYEEEIRVSNPNSSVEIDCVRNAEGQDVFNIFYVCFDNLRRSWKATCRPLIGVDVCFLRSRIKGQVLVALGRDADNAIYHIAWAVVQAENYLNWVWFLKKIKTDLELKSGEGFVMVSDRHKGLIKAVQEQLPKIEHRMCVRHIYGNLKVKHGKRPDMKWMIWQLSWSYNETEYKDRLDKIANYDSVVYADVIKSKPQTWCRLFYKIRNHVEDVENNSTESWNKTISKAREMVFVPMLETIARLAMVRIAKRDVEACTWDGLRTPYVVNYLLGLHKKASECKVYRSTNNTYDARLSGCSYRVSLDSRTCSCKRWEITGIPCEHGYAVIMHKKLEAQDYVSHWFKTELWRRTYKDGVIPLRGARFWPESNKPDVHLDPSSVKEKPYNKRKRGVNESPIKKADKQLKRTMHCLICHAPNHNSRFHKNDTQVSLGESSGTTSNQPSQPTQTEASQGTVT